MATLTVDMPQSQEELDALYAKLKLNMPPQPIPKTNAEFEAQYELFFDAKHPVLDDRAQIGHCSFKGERMPHMREPVQHQLEDLCKQYAHVLQDKAEQSAAEVRRGNQDASEFLLHILLLIAQTVPRLWMRLELNELPQPDHTLCERLCIAAAALVAIFSPKLERRLVQRWGLLLERDTLQYLTTREACRILTGVLRLELADKLWTFGELCQQAAAGDTYVAPRRTPAKHVSETFLISKLYLDTLRRVISPDPMPA